MESILSQINPDHTIKSYVLKLILIFSCQDTVLTITSFRCLQANILAAAEALTSVWSLIQLTGSLEGKNF
jgi:hypothetical protein